tara:strand:+ start:2775 stop:3404 length:630 start_codon:yes stop_codon:yes gene_type:complete
MTDSLSLKARQQTEEFILQGRLSAGEKITERDLAERLGMSRAPVREAIRELINVGLLEQISARQIVVRELLLSEVREIFAIREMLEAKASALAATRMSKSDLDALDQLHQNMKAAAINQDFSAYFDLNIQFHKRIHQVADSPRLTALIDQVMRESLLFRSRSLASHANIQASIEEHEQLLKAFQERDEQLASLLMSRHINGGFKRLELL